MVVGSTLGLQATVFYLAVYLVMNVAAFAVVVARERVSEHGDDIASLENLGQTQPWLAWPMTIAMLSLAGFPATAGFIGKFYLIDAAVAGDYAWLGIVIVVGAVVSLAYYLRVVAVMWMGRYEVELPTVPPRQVKPVSGWSPEADLRAQPEVAVIAIAVRGGDDPLRHLAGPAVRRRARHRHVALGPALGLGRRRTAANKRVPISECGPRKASYARALLPTLATDALRSPQRLEGSEG